MSHTQLKLFFFPASQNSSEFTLTLPAYQYENSAVLLQPQCHFFFFYINCITSKWMGNNLAKSKPSHTISKFKTLTYSQTVVSNVYFVVFMQDTVFTKFLQIRPPILPFSHTCYFSEQLKPSLIQLFKATAMLQMLPFLKVITMLFNFAWLFD